MKVSNIKDGKRIAVTHGELFLLPIEEAPKLKSETHKQYVLAHSETGHHHVLESKTEFEVMSDEEKDELFIRLFEPAKLVHKKTFDIHETRTLATGLYKVFKKKEYDIREKAMRKVFD